MLYSICRLIALIGFKFLFRVKAYGRNNIPKSGAFILASNHVSNLDPMALGVVCPRKLNFMAKDNLFSNRFLYWFFTNLRCFPVNRSTADISALREAMKRLKNGGALLLFPEGSRSLNGSFTEPEPGIGFLAGKLQIPVVPAFVKGTEDALPKGAKTIRPNKISVIFGKQILVERRMPYQQIAELIMENIRHLAC
jgi:1-acyl-sn-glycerol-3-phosphate acyltransferase